MKKQWFTRNAIGRVAGFLAVVFAVVAGFLSLPAAGQVTAKSVADTIEISGQRPKPWTLRYSNPPDISKSFPWLFVEAGNRAWFSHDSWLRLIDTEKGVVLGCWHMPGDIAKLEPHDGRVTVTVHASTGLDTYTLTRTYEFDPANPNVPYWTQGHLLSYRVAEFEARFALPGASADLRGVPTSKQPADVARASLPLLEEAIARDPYTMWFRLQYGQRLGDLGDPRSDKVLQDAVAMPNLDFTQLFEMSAFFVNTGRGPLAVAAFDRGYADYLRRGYDPRLMLALIDRIVLFRADFAKIGERLSPPDVEAMRERLFRLAPYTEGGAAAWQIYADVARAEGRSADADRWHARSQETLRRSGYLNYPGWTDNYDRCLLLLWGGVLAAIVFLVAQRVRYGPQLALDRAAAVRLNQRRRYPFRSLAYWSMRERIAFLLLAAVLWSVAGVAGIYLRGFIKMAASPLDPYFGSFSGPIPIWDFDRRLLSNAGRDVMRAFAYQQDGNPKAAEDLYRSAPAFPESWNNLGVLLKKSHRDAEAQQAFERARQMNPELTEASYNLGRGASSFWTQLHQQYLPGEPMLAVPSRAAMEEAHAGNGWQRLGYALRGPFNAGPNTGYLRPLLESERLMPYFALPMFLTIALTLLALVELFLVPYLDVTQAAPRNWERSQIFLPGLARSYHVAGPFVLMVWLAVLQQIAMLYSPVGSPYLATFLGLPNLSRAFGQPLASSAAAQQSARSLGLVAHVPGGAHALLNPWWLTLFGFPLLLFAINAVVLWRERRQSRSESTAAASAQA